MDAHEVLLRKYMEGDQIAKTFGIELISIGEGAAVTRMPLTSAHLNGFGTMHGAAGFALADFTFGAASNSRDTIALGINTTMSYVKAVRAGVLHGTATETSFTPKLATYNVLITDDEGDTVALFTGMVYRKKDRIEDVVAARGKHE